MEENYDFLNQINKINNDLLIKNESIILTSYIKKYNKIGMLKERSLFISNLRIIILKNKNIKYSNWIYNIKNILLSTTSNEFIIKFTNNKLFHLNVYESKNKIFICILNILEKHHNINFINFYFLKEINLKKYRSIDPPDSFLESFNYQKLKRYSNEENKNIRKTRRSTIILFNNIKEEDVITILDFNLIKVMGKGAFGKIVLAQKKDSVKFYAIKILNKVEILSKNQLEHTKAEKMIMEHVNHPFLVNLDYAFQTFDKIYFVMEFLKGGELFYHFSKEKRFNEERVKFYISSLILGLGHLHSKNFIYRDLKLENILLDSNGYIKLADFGLAKMININEKALTFCGTPDYLAPEIILGKGHNRPADWWSLGVLTYEMLYGITPFYDKEVNNIFKKIVKNDIIFYDQIKISDDCKDFINKLTTKDPELRFGSNADSLEIISHPWLKSLNWSKIMNKSYKAPFIPEISDSEFMKNFDLEYTKNDIIDQKRLIIDFKNLEPIQNEFKDFNYIKNN